MIHHTFVHENMKTLMTGFRYDAHPMGMFVSVVAALGTIYPEAAQVDNADVRLAQVIRLIAKVPTISAWSYRHNKGMPYVYPDNDLSFAENFLSMMFKMAESRYSPDPALVRALDVAVHPPRRPRAELLDERDARDRLEPRRPVQRARRRRRRRSTGRSTAAPTRPS